MPTDSTEKPRPRYCPECGDVMAVLAPSYHSPNVAENWRHECTDCNIVRTEGEMADE